MALAMKMRDESGGSLVEFAVIAPLLFVILFGIIEFGILLYDQAKITNASREGARAGIVFDTTLRNSDNTVNTAAVAEGEPGRFRLLHGQPDLIRIRGRTLGGGFGGWCSGRTGDCDRELPFSLPCVLQRYRADRGG